MSVSGFELGLSDMEEVELEVMLCWPVVTTLVAFFGGLVTTGVGLVPPKVWLVAFACGLVSPTVGLVAFGVGIVTAEVGLVFPKVGLVAFGVGVVTAEVELVAFGVGVVPADVGLVMSGALLSVPLSRGDGLGVTGDAPDVVPAGVGLVTSAVDTVGPVLAGAVRLVGT